VLTAEPGELARAAARDVQAHHAVIVLVSFPSEEPGADRPVDELARGVVTQEQRVGDLADGRSALLGAPAHGEEQLVLRSRQALGLGALLAPAKEPAQLGAEPEQVLVVAFREPGLGRHD